MSRVSTMGQYQMSITSMMRIESDFAAVQKQLSSEQKADSYSGLSSNTERVVSLENEVTRSNKLVEQGEIVQSRIESQYSAVDGMVDVLSNYQVDLSSAISGQNAETSALNENAQVGLESFTDLANLEVSGRYLFGGGVTDRPPVDIGNPPYAPQTAPTTADTSYYQGDDAIASILTSKTRKIEYGVSANNSGFEKAIRALSIGANAAENPQDNNSLNEAYDLVNQAIDELLVIQSSLSASASSLSDVVDGEIEYQLYLDAMVSDIKDVDLAAVITQQEQIQAQLEASYSATAKISQLRLSDFL